MAKHRPGMFDLPDSGDKSNETKSDEIVPGSLCPTPGCPGVISVISTFVHQTEGRIRYLQCETCKKPSPMKVQRIPLKYVTYQKRRKNWRERKPGER